MKLPVDVGRLLGWIGAAGGLLGVLFFFFRSNGFLQKFNYPDFFRKRRGQDYAVALLNRLFKLMNEEKPYLEKNISLDHLAARLEVSALQLSQVITENLEQSFTDLIATYRIQEAKRLLVTPEYRHSKLDELALLVGYESMAHFNEAFKKYTEQTPAEYKNRMNMICL